MRQPHRPKQGIIPLLIQEKLSTMPESRIHLTITIDIRRHGPGSRHLVEIEDAAFADVDVETYILLTSEKKRVSEFRSEKG